MKQTKYYKNYREVLKNESKWLQTVYFGFVKQNIHIDTLDDLVQKMEDKMISNTIYITENLVIFQTEINSKYKFENYSKRNFQKMRMMPGVIVYAPMSYREYNVTKTARQIIIENNVYEKEWRNDCFISIHEKKLSIETIQTKHDISLELKNINIAIEDMEGERKKEIKMRILECLSK